MTVVLVFRNTDGTVTEEQEVLSFRFTKEAYRPYTELDTRFRCHDTDTDKVTEVLFYVGGRLIHHGLIDSLTVTFSGGYRTAVLSSRSFSCMLAQNQMKPGLYTSISINKLMDSMLHIPYVTHEDDSDDSGYIYVNYGSTLWEAITTLAYKKNGIYPYIRGTNCVMFSPEASPQSFSYGSGELLSYGTEVSEKRMESDFHMENMAGEYGEYDLNDPDVTARKIVRHRWFELDRQFLYDPVQALQYRDQVACRGWRRRFCTYSGYSGEDLSDLVSFRDTESERITALTITGSRRGIITEISTYRDRFYNS